MEATSNHSNVTFVNINACNQPAPNWEFVPICMIICSILSAILNAITVTLFIRIDRVRPTPLNTFFIFLLSLDIYEAIVASPMDTLNMLFPTWTFGSKICTLNILLTWTAQGVIPNIHVLILSNRLISVVFPVFSRRYVTRRTVLISCFGTIVYVYCFILPTIITDALLFRLPECENGCFVNFPAQGAYGQLVEWLIYNTPILAVFTMYGILVHKMLRRRRARVAAVSLRPQNRKFDYCNVWILRADTSETWSPK